MPIYTTKIRKLKGFPSQPWHKDLGGCGCPQCSACSIVRIWSKLKDQNDADRLVDEIFNMEDIGDEAQRERDRLCDLFNGPHGYTLFRTMMARKSK